MNTANEQAWSRPQKRNLAPYLLILPSIFYLVLFFAWPMIQGLGMAVWKSDALLILRTEPAQGSSESGRLPQGTALEIVDRRGNVIPPEDLAETSNLVTEVWFLASGEDAGGAKVSGWTPSTRIRVREEDEAGNPRVGTVRRKLVSKADPKTALYAEPNKDSEIVGYLEPRTRVAIEDVRTLEVWFRVRGEYKGETVEGWAQSRYIQVFGDKTQGRVDRGDTGQFTTEFIQKMVNDRFFKPALIATVVLSLLIIPAQLILAILMALVVQARLKGSTLFLYVFAIPLAISDLAAGILWFAIFTQHGFLNSILQGLGLIDSPITYLSTDTRYWIFIAIWLAEVWRATSLVMIIVVSGLQAISQEVLEAAEVFGAGLWARVRYIILPLIRSSLQVALILRTIFALQIFAVVVALSGGDVVTSLANETYRQYSTLRNPNVAASYATFILLLSLGVAFFYLRAIRTQQELEA